MQLQLGGKIRELRRRDGRTQEALAHALGVTSQAVSRREASGSYPDMELIPAIANYFGVSIDELFGYQGERESRIDALLAKVDELDRQNGGTDATLDECIHLLRNGLAEFPGNERITLRLAQVLSETGWIRHGEKSVTNAEGYTVHDAEYHKRNEYWSEATKLLESLVYGGCDESLLSTAKYELILQYRNVGEYEKAVSLANTFPDVRRSRELLLADATDGRERAKYLGTAVLALADALSEMVVQTLIASHAKLSSKFFVDTLEKTIRPFDLACEDGNYGLYASKISCLYLYLAEHQWAAGAKDDAFASLDKALEYARQFYALDGQKDAIFTSPLLEGIPMNPGGGHLENMPKDLPEIWPFWCVPNLEEVQKEIKNAPRWAEWVQKARQ